jgi:hypothetical protein
MAEKEALGVVNVPGEQPPPPTNTASTTATLDDLKKLESSILSQMKAMLEELIVPKPNPTIDPKASTGGSPPLAIPFPLLNFVPEKDKAREEENRGDTGTSCSKGKDEPRGEECLGGNHACHHQVITPEMLQFLCHI